MTVNLLVYALLPSVAILIIFFLRRPLYNTVKPLVRGLSDFSFAVMMSSVTPYYNKKMYSRKKELFKSLGEHLKLVEGDIVEIGVGSGANFGFYPDGCSVIAVDRNGHFERFLRWTKNLYPKITLKKYITGTAEEDMRGIEDNSVSVVVSTLVLCSVVSGEQVMREVVRILKPGGRLYFLEHVAGVGWRLTFQRWNDIFWPYFNDGCCLTCRTEDLIRKSGFKNIECLRFHCNLWYPALKPHIMGYAEV